MLRMWVLASGRPGPSGYLLGVDPLAPQMHEGLLAALAPLGVHARLLGPKAEAPAVRLNGRRRLDSLVELIGDPPAGAEAAWPDLSRDLGAEQDNGLKASESCVGDEAREGASDGEPGGGETGTGGGKGRRGAGRRTEDDGPGGQVGIGPVADGDPGVTPAGGEAPRRGSKEAGRRRAHRGESVRRGRAARAEGDPRREQSSDESPLQYLLGVAG